VLNFNGVHIWFLYNCNLIDNIIIYNIIYNEKIPYSKNHDNEKWICKYTVFLCNCALNGSALHKFSNFRVHVNNTMRRKRLFFLLFAKKNDRIKMDYYRMRSEVNEKY
jgi:hypothetical protein